MDTDAASVFWFVVPGVVVPAALLVLAFRSPSARQLHRWASGCGVRITDANEDLVRSHLGRVRRFRSAAAFPFWWLATVPLVVGARLPTQLTTPMPALVAYVVGALVGELTARPVASGPLKQASLEPRTVPDFRPGWSSVLPRATLVVAAVIVALSPGDDRPSRVAAITTLVVGLALVTASELATRHIVDRPQRSGDADVLAADDALRATAVAMTSAVAVLGGLAAFSWAVQAVTPAPTGWWAALSFVALIGCSGLGIGMMMTIVRQETWGYRRRHRQRTLAELS